MKHLIFPLLIVLLVSSCKKQEGCTDATASNYDVSAERDDGSCTYPGCTDSDALNYYAGANSNDGSCLYMCTDPQATNYNDTITEPVCTYETNIVIWLESTASEYFDSVGVEALSVYAGGALIPKLMVPAEDF